MKWTNPTKNLKIYILIKMTQEKIESINNPAKL